ncbi:MAG: Cell division protein FtsE, partial [Microgenomates bacterium 39_7]
MNIIQFKQVAKEFPDGTIAFNDLSFDVEEGEIVLVTGPSGSGKTTIMRLLIGEYTPNQGEILFEDHLLNKLKPQQLHLHRRKIGVVFQDYKLIEELNVWENVALPLLIRNEKQSTIEERVTDLLKLVELTDKAMMFPRQLSGGEAQRISIARALANSPKVIFADEPTGNLDQESGKHILKLLTKINELGTTLLIATHDPVIVGEIKAKKIDLSENTRKSQEDDVKLTQNFMEELVKDSAYNEKDKNNKKPQKEDKSKSKNKEK